MGRPEHNGCAAATAGRACPDLPIPAARPRRRAVCRFLTGPIDGRPGRRGGGSRTADDTLLTRPAASARAALRRSKEVAVLSLSKRRLALILTALFAAQPVLVVQQACAAAPDEPDPPPAEVIVVESEAVDDAGPVDAAPATEADDAGRAQIAADLVDLGYAPELAADMAAQLTPDDLAVLTANPKMMQQAGTMSNTTIALIVGGLIVAGIIILAANGSGFVSIG
jgi:hypothetical protein